MEPTKVEPSAFTNSHPHAHTHTRREYDTKLQKYNHAFKNQRLKGNMDA